MKFHFPFAAGGAVSAPAAASTAADGGMIDVTAGKNEEDGDHRHHSIDRGIHGYLLLCIREKSKMRTRFRIRPWGMLPLDRLRKRGRGSYRFRGFSGGGAAHFVILSGEKRRI